MQKVSSKEGVHINSRRVINLLLGGKAVVDTCLLVVLLDPLLGRRRLPACACVSSEC